MQRYDSCDDCCFDMQPCEEGEWVLFKDAQKELDERMRQLIKLEKELAEAQDVIVKLSKCLLEYREKEGK